MPLFTLPKAVRIDSGGTPYGAAKFYFYTTGTTNLEDVYTTSALSVAHDNPVVAAADGQLAAVYLDPDVTYRCIIKESDDTQIDDVDPVFAPVAALNVSVTDTGGYFAGTEVETILADIGANYGKTTQADTWSADQTFSSADLKMADNIVERPEIKDFGITHNDITSTSNAITADCSTGNSFYHLLTENTTFTLSNPPASGTFGQITIYIKQDGAGGAYTVGWPATVRWPGGTAPVISATNNAIDVITLFTVDGGAIWLGNFSQAYAAPS